MSTQGNSPVTGKVSLHTRRKRVFSEPVVPSANEIGFAGLRFTVDLDQRRIYKVNFEDYPIRSLARGIASLLYAETQPTGCFKSVGYVAQIVHSWWRFAECLIARRWESVVTDLHDITTEHLDAFEDDMIVRCGIHSSAGYQYVATLNRFLRLARSRNLASPELDSRLIIVAHRITRSRNPPRDAYSPFVVQQLRQAAVKDIEAVVQRIAVVGEKLLSEGIDPAIGGWGDYRNVLWAIANHGFVEPTSLEPKATMLLYNLVGYGQPYRLTDLPPFIHLTIDDVLPFIIYLSLETGLPIECLWDLPFDCLRNEINGRSDLTYIKRRTGTAETKIIRVATADHMSAGYIIRLIQRLTRTTRAHVDKRKSKLLFIGYSLTGRKGNKLRRFTGAYDAIPGFLDRHMIMDDQGQRVSHITLSRLRKSFKQERYLSAAGHIADVATDHGRRVFVEHYADIPSLRPLHQKTVAQALEEAVKVALEPVISDAATEQLIYTDPPKAAAALGLAAEQIETIASGTSDVWLVSCLGFRNPPHQPLGDGDCRSAVWGCLDCSNAVFTSSKLPALLSFLNHILQRRNQMSIDAWSTRYGRAYGRIVCQILPRFPAKEVAMAKAVAEAESDLIWLPPELIYSR